MSIFKLEKPNLANYGDKETLNFLMGLSQKENLLDELTALVSKVMRPRYLYWDEVKYKPTPGWISKEQLWAVVKFFRKTNASSKSSPIKSESGSYFTWVKLPDYDEFLHQLDMNTGGMILGFGSQLNEKNTYKFISKGIMEEAIASSQLEGADTTRAAAKKMLREGRKPQTEGERMILNNYAAMKGIEEKYKNRELSVDMLLELHAVLMEDTVPGDEIGRFRKNEDGIVVSDIRDGTIYHTPPPIEFVRQEIDRLIEFANDELQEGAFVHPVIKAIMLHFWLGYLHPFTNGNGRLARLVFHWYLLRKNYWAISYLPISTAIKRAKMQYVMSYVYSEQDDFDLTYFIDYNIKKIQQALADFEEYIKKKSKENSIMRKNCQQKYELNDRQIQLLQYLHKNSEGSTSWKTHMNINNVSKLTAIKDLKSLEAKDFLVSKKTGRNVNYFATSKVEELFK